MQSQLQGVTGRVKPGRENLLAVIGKNFHAGCINPGLQATAGCSFCMPFGAPKPRRIGKIQLHGLTVWLKRKMETGAEIQYKRKVFGVVQAQFQRQRQRPGRFNRTGVSAQLLEFPNGELTENAVLFRDNPRQG